MRVSEVYASVQGEGPRVGETTVFLRFGGCNLRCPGWPCDTQHAIDPAYRSEWTKYTPEELAEVVDEVAMFAGAKLITLTGGEPFLQPRGELEQLVQQLRDKGFRIEAFTNGTLEYPEWAIDHVAMIMDYKLPGSGEDHLNEQRLKNLVNLTRRRPGYHAAKFVCKDENDFMVAFSLWSLTEPEVRDNIQWYYGIVWGAMENKDLVALVLEAKLPWKLNVQIHNNIWPRDERGR